MIHCLCSSCIDQHQRAPTAILIICINTTRAINTAVCVRLFTSTLDIVGLCAFTIIRSTIDKLKTKPYKRATASQPAIHTVLIAEIDLAMRGGRGVSSWLWIIVIFKEYILRIEYSDSWGMRTDHSKPRSVALQSKLVIKKWSHCEGGTAARGYSYNHGARARGLL